MEENNINLPNINMQSQKSNNEIHQDNSNKEKIRYKIVIPISILIAVLITTVVIVIRQNILSNEQHYNHSGSSIEKPAHSGQFTGYFGERVSASDVKALVSLIRSNNITSQTAGETKTIAIKFTKESGSGTIMAPSAVSRALIFGKTYWVGAENEEECESDEDPTESSATDTTSAYYKSGYLRIITIKENGKKTGE